MLSSKNTFSTILVFAISFTSLPTLASMQVIHDINFPESETSSSVKKCDAQNTCENQTVHNNQK